LGELSLVTLALPLFVQLDLVSNVRAAVRIDGPEVVMDTTKRDFGDVFAGEVLEQIFLVRNAGTKALELKQKSTLGTRSTPLRYALTPALWRASGQSLTRGAAAMRAAPS